MLHTIVGCPQPSASENIINTDGYVIPSLTGGESEMGSPHVPEEVADRKPPSTRRRYIWATRGPAVPSQAAQEQQNPTAYRQRFKNKLKEADRKFAGAGRENKLDALRELVGSNSPASLALPKSSPRDWLDPHCHESHFEKHPR
ncbi:unnamed protein product [Spirodela intermedia]|uniref:Uncharacterized protein n=1 Tax=Spirodela intermedia TaxID=51605 RepID=A0A7I8I868_SPIIN|nr:unnamed protein product [Spirodela intermedia]CAA6653603.1 unnamed protein product [Spirodela intermedia]